MFMIVRLFNELSLWVSYGFIRKEQREQYLFSVLVLDAASWNIIRWTLVIADVDRIVGHICSYEFEIRL